MTGILKVDQWKDSGDNTLMTSDGAGNLTVNAPFSSTGIDDNATSTAITIDSSGEVLVGTTSTDNADQGVRLKNYGLINGTATSDVCLLLNRKTSDGTIAQFRKDNAVVGSIGVFGGDALYIGDNLGGGTGLRFDSGGADDILPCSGAGATRDNAIDLGNSSARFKDLYLGGNIYLGGTGSANALDDYEEGTWTPNFTYTTTTPSFSYVTRSGRYTKIGRLVQIGFQLNVTNINTAGASGEIEITGLPFPCKSQSLATGAVMVYAADVYANTYDVTINVQDNSSNFRFIQSRDNEGWINLSTANDAGQLVFQSSFVYDTDS